MNPYTVVIGGVIVSWFIAMVVFIPWDLACLAKEMREEEAGLGQERLLTAEEAPAVVTAETGPYDWAKDVA